MESYAMSPSSTSDLSTNQIDAYPTRASRYLQHLFAKVQVVQVLTVFQSLRVLRIVVASSCMTTMCVATWECPRMFCEAGHGTLSDQM